jgi:hypothetical protein
MAEKASLGVCWCRLAHSGDFHSLLVERVKRGRRHKKKEKKKKVVVCHAKFTGFLYLQTESLFDYTGWIRTRENRKQQRGGDFTP